MNYILGDQNRIAEESAHSEILSHEQSRLLARRIMDMTSNGGNTMVAFNISWVGNLRWARNRVNTGGETQATQIMISREINGARGSAVINTVADETLQGAVKRAEEVAQLQTENPERYPDIPSQALPHLKPEIWFDSTYGVSPESRGVAAEKLIKVVEDEGLVAAGYIETAARGSSVFNNENVDRYYPYTTSQYSVTVRDPDGTASGWAGIDFNDWNRIDTGLITKRAIEKCRKSANPVAIEPGRYTTILEPQALHGMLSILMGRPLDREAAESGVGPFAAPGGNSKIGQRVIDERITLSSDPMDPDCGFVPFDSVGEPMVPVKWIEEGVLKELYYSRWYGLKSLTKDQALPFNGAFSMSGGSTLMDEMVATTERGVLVTRFNNRPTVLDPQSLLMTGNTRDGLWLIERGKITRSIKNFRFTDSPFFVLNNVLQLGVPERVFSPGIPAVCPTIKVRDFAFTALMDAV